MSTKEIYNNMTSRVNQIIEENYGSEDNLIKNLQFC